MQLLEVSLRGAMEETLEVGERGAQLGRLGAAGDRRSQAGDLGTSGLVCPCGETPGVLLVQTPGPGT